MKRLLLFILGGLFGLVFSVYAQPNEIKQEPITTNTGSIFTGEILTGEKITTPVKKVEAPRKNLPEYINETQEIRIKGFPEGALAHQLATRYYREAGRDMLLTMLGENGGFNHLIISPTRDYGLCQLNRAASSQAQRDFIGHLSGGVMIFSEQFNNPQTQADYCIRKRNVAASKRIRTAYDNRRANAHKVSIVDVNYNNLY